MFPFLAGSLDAILDEIIALPMLIKGVVEIFTDEKKQRELRQLFTADGLKLLWDELKGEWLEKGDEEQIDYNAGSRVVSVVTMAIPGLQLNKAGKLDNVLRAITDGAEKLPGAKVVNFLEDLKKAERTVANEKSIQEFTEKVGFDYIEESADEVRDITTKFKRKLTIDEVKKFWARGKRFNEKVEGLQPRKYLFHEIEVEVSLNINGKNVRKRFRLDSYDFGEGGKIVSRKATDFDTIQLKTFDNYLLEMKRKYPVGAIIYSRKYPDDLPYGTKTLQGKYYMEVPKHNQNSKRLDEFQKLADDRNVILIFEEE